MSSTNHDRSIVGELVPVRLSRLTRPGVLLALSLTQLVTVAISGATPIGALHAGWWLWRTTGGQRLYRRRIVVPRTVSTHGRPGDMARLRANNYPDTGTGMNHDPDIATLTVVC